MLNIKIGIFLLFSFFLISFFIATTSIDGQMPQNSNTTNKTAADRIAANSITQNTTGNTGLVYRSIFDSSLPFYFLGVIALAMVIPLTFDMIFAYLKKPKESLDKEVESLLSGCRDCTEPL